LGSALQLQARAKLNAFNASYNVLSGDMPSQRGFDQLGRRINLGLQYPRVLSLLPVEIGSRVDLVHERVIRPAYAFTRGAAILGADWTGQGPVSISMQYEIEGDEVQRANQRGLQLSRTDIERLRFDEGTIYLHSVRPSISVDFRDDPANPRKGVWFSGSTELVQSLGGSVQGLNGPETPQALFLKASGQASAFIPLPKQMVFALALKGGKVFPLDENSRTIAPKRFFQGGATTMRGFRDDAMIPEDRRQAIREQVQQCVATLNRTGCSDEAQKLLRGDPFISEGGELFTLARGELRFPLSGQLEAALFLDAGNLWLDQARFDPWRLRYATGLGLRVVTPIGPAALDFGLNLQPDRVLNENQLVVHFSIGVF
ncbi:MAG: BamA/TamA family outer membrane protein, partial [Myxococcales bacterium]